LTQIAVLATTIEMLVFACAALADRTDSVSIRVAKHARVGEHVPAVFAGHDAAPRRTHGTLLAAVLEPPLGKGGGYCKANLEKTVNKHPRSKILTYQKRVDRSHRGRFRLKLRMPAVHKTGKWRVCAWQFNDDGNSTYEFPASRASARFRVSKR
jgi:hypothetical protein